MPRGYWPTGHYINKYYGSQRPASIGVIKVKKGVKKAECRHSFFV